MTQQGSAAFSINDTVRFCPVNEVSDMVMDHMDILKGAPAHLRVEILSHPVAFGLLPEKFTLSQMQKLYEVILEKTFDKRNFRKKFANMKYLIPLNEKEVGVAHSPARFYFFSREEYTKIMNDNMGN